MNHFITEINIPFARLTWMCVYNQRTCQVYCDVCLKNVMWVEKHITRQVNCNAHVNMGCGGNHNVR